MARTLQDCCEVSEIHSRHFPFSKFSKGIASHSQRAQTTVGYTSATGAGKSSWKTVKMATPRHFFVLAALLPLPFGGCSDQLASNTSASTNVAAPKSTNMAVDIQNDEFAFQLAGDWVRVPNLDTNQFSFESKSNKSSVILSVMPLAISQDKLIEAAEKFAEIRQKAEQESRQDQKIEFGDKWVELRPSKDVAEVAYAGYDDKTIFRFMGFVTQRKAVSLWVSTESHDNESSKKVFGEVYEGLRFYVP